MAKGKGFSPAVKLFIQHLIDHPNVTRAYKRAYPNAKTTSASAAGSRLFGNVRVRAAVEAGRKARLDRLQMDGDEAMKRIAVIGKLDIRNLYDDEGKILPVSEWSDELALAVKSIEEKQYGTRVTFDSRLAALELIAAADGKLVREVKVTTTLADLLAEHAKPEEIVKKKKGRD
jgi:phage terminase small subunit